MKNRLDAISITEKEYTCFQNLVENAEMVVNATKKHHYDLQEFAKKKRIVLASLRSQHAKDFWNMILMYYC